MTDLFRAIVGVVAVFALLVQYGLLVARADEGGALGATLVYVSYFTIITNWIGAAALLAPVAARYTGVGHFFNHQGVRAAAALYLALVAIVYHTILAAQWNPEGWQFFTDIVFHTVTPAMVWIDWLFLTPKRDLNLSMVPAWLIVPVAFGAWTRRAARSAAFILIRSCASTTSAIRRSSST